MCNSSTCTYSAFDEGASPPSFMRQLRDAVARAKATFTADTSRRRWRRFVLSGPYRIFLLAVFLLGSTLYHNQDLITSLSYITPSPSWWQDTPSIHDDCNVDGHDDLPLCFLTAQYTANVNATDTLTTPAQRHPQLLERAKFYVFTNLPELVVPEGWEKVVRTYPQYSRFITQSRAPKFQGFYDPIIQDNCRVVFYLDGSVEILGSWQDFMSDARRIVADDNSTQNNNPGLMQPLHPFGNNIQEDFAKIREFGKDTQHNLNITRHWLEQQDDYSSQIPVYSNMYFGYDVQSPVFRKAADYFWNTYSKEIGSWRDQPLWAYTLHHFNVTPLNFEGQTESDDDNDHGGGRQQQQQSKILFRRIAQREGMNGHSYAAKMDHREKSGNQVSTWRDKRQAKVKKYPPTRNATATTSISTNTASGRPSFLDRICKLSKEKAIALASSYEKRCDEIDEKEAKR